jgi:hypothetical protein
MSLVCVNYVTLKSEAEQELSFNYKPASVFVEHQSLTQAEQERVLRQSA